MAAMYRQAGNDDQSTYPQLKQRNDILSTGTRYIFLAGPVICFDFENNYRVNARSMTNQALGFAK
jgi:hypothetical protein